MTKITKTVEKHFAKLQVLARRNKGKLPSVKSLNANGHFYSYDVVRKAGLLNQFKRVNLKQR
jgi:hypothetical protein